MTNCADILPKTESRLSTSVLMKAAVFTPKIFPAKV